MGDAARNARANAAARKDNSEEVARRRAAIEHEIEERYYFLFVSNGTLKFLKFAEIQWYSNFLCQKKVYTVCCR